MKIKVLSVIFSAILVLSLTGCGKDDVDSSASDTGSSTTEVADNATDSTSVSGTFVKMNIPYGDFFANEFEGGEGVDAVSSATMNKAANDKLTGGTYHLKDNSKILGVSFPVCIPEGTEIDDSLKVNDEASLYDAAYYSYVELAEIPKNYKELSKDSSGKYTLTINDKSGVYAPYTADFVLSTDKAVAAASENGVVKADNASDDEFAAYIKNIEAYDVNGNEVSGTGHKGAKIIKEDGTVDKTLSNVFDKTGKFKVVIKSSGYPDVTLDVDITEVAPAKEEPKK